jgi:hypothetical protein
MREVGIKLMAAVGKVNEIPVEKLARDVRQFRFFS